MATRLFIDDNLGETILNRISSYNNDMDISLIIIAIPNVMDGQPTFVTNLPGEVMEALLKSMTESMTPDFVKSRRIVGKETQH